MIDLNSGRMDVCIRDVLYKTESMVLPFFRRTNRHSCSIVFYIKGGHRHSMENGNEFTNRSYDLLYLPYGSNYVSAVTDKNIEYYQINFEIYEKGLQKRLFDSEFTINSPESSVFLPHLLDIYNLYTVRPQGYKISALSHLLALISLLAQEKDDDYPKIAARKRIRPALEYIGANYQRDMDVKELALTCGLSVSGLEKNFIKATGATPVAYRNSIRIEHAKTLLLGGFQISEVTERVGFSDLYYFAKTFKRIVGITPGKFIRERIK